MQRYATQIHAQQAYTREAFSFREGLFVSRSNVRIPIPNLLSIRTPFLHRRGTEREAQEEQRRNRVNPHGY